MADTLPVTPPAGGAPTTGVPQDVQDFDFSKIVQVDLENLDLTTEKVDLTGVDEDLQAFQDNAMVRHALEKNVDLGRYARKIEDELAKVELASIEDYVRNSDDLVLLHEQIQNCDSLLEQMQQMLSGFQDHLKTISSDIRHLQDRSLSMNLELNNRKLAQKHMSKYVDQLELPNDFIVQVTSGPLGKEYIEPLTQLNGKMEFHSSLDSSFCAAQDIATDLETLKNRAVVRLRQFLIKQFQELGIPRTNINLKQQHLLGFKYFQTFVTSHSPEVGIELRTYYTDLMSKVYMGHFRTYVQSLSKHKEAQIPDRNDLIGTDVERTGGLFAAKKSSEWLNHVFTIGNRAAIVDEFKESPIVIQMVQPTDKFQYETIFRSFLRLLSDTATNEYRFILQFFNRRDMFNYIFEKVLALFLEEFDSFRLQCYDSIGLLLMIRLVERHQEELVNRKIACLEPFFDKLNMNLWPRFKIVFDENVKSIANLVPTKKDIIALKESVSAPHFTTIRFSTLTTAILILNQNKQQPILNDCARQLRETFERLLHRFAEKIESEKYRLVFLISNYSIVISAMNGGKLQNDTEYNSFSDTLHTLEDKYIEIELKQHLSRWIGFTLATEAKFQSDPKTQINMAQLESIVVEFGKMWQRAVQCAIRNVQSNFVPNLPASVAKDVGEKELFVISKDILKKMLSQLLIYHARFLNVVHKISSNQGRNANIMQHIVQDNTLRYEIRKYWQDA